MRALRYQLPVYSPLSPVHVWQAIRPAAGVPLDRSADLARRLGREYAADRVLLCGSGTQALQLALRIARDRRGPLTPIALPCYSCFDVASAAVGARAHVLFYDLDPATLAPDLDSLRRVFAAGARTAVIAYLHGYPVDWAAVEACARHYDVLLIEDAAQGHGGHWSDRPLGSLAPLSVLSFGRGKGWTGGGGGALLLRGEAAGAGADAGPAPPAASSNGGRALGTALAQWALGRPAVYGLPLAIPWLKLGETVYREPEPPRTMSPTAAALLTASWDPARRESERRRRIAQDLLDCLRAATHVRTIRSSPEAAPGFLRLPVRTRHGLPALARRLGVASGYPALLPSLPQLGHLCARQLRRWPGGETLVRELVTLPTHSRLNAADRIQLLHLFNT